MSRRHQPGNVPALVVEIVLADGTAVAQHSDFEVNLAWTDAQPGWEVTVRAAYRGARSVRAGIRVSTTVTDAADPWWLIPGAFYGENRPAENSRRFPRFEIGATTADDAAVLVSNAWEFRADRAATPAVFVWASPGHGGVAVAAAGSTSLGITGLGLAHDAATATAIVHLTFPYREGPVSYYGDATPRPADVATHEFRPGELVDLTLRVFTVEADRHAYAPILRALHAESARRRRCAPGSTSQRRPTSRRKGCTAGTMTLTRAFCSRPSVSIGRSAGATV